MNPRTVVITGGTRGMGKETALAFARAGYFVVALYRSDELAAGQLRDALVEAGALGCVLRHDVTSEEDGAVWNRPEIQEAENLTLIHNACAFFSPRPLHQLRWYEVEAGLDVAVKGGWLCAQALIRLMVRSGRGTIVNVLTAALDGIPPKGFADYIIAKHALRGLTLALASEFSSRGVRVFTVSPGFMETSLTAQWDARLREAVREGSARITDPAAAGRRIMELVENETVPGQGEDYPI